MKNTLAYYSKLETTVINNLTVLNISARKIHCKIKANTISVMFFENTFLCGGGDGLIKHYIIKIIQSTFEVVV